ncbi:MAG: ribonuclease H family protein, partial [Atopostipes suicloacalis]|nr:ribonuclease H family protein [Atopostipes suicloacalis]
MSKKYYAVLEGRHPGIYETWTEAKDEVHGYPGALYQSFKNLADAKNYLNQAQSQKQKSPSDQLIAYVDGSFDKKSESYSFGAVLILNNQVIKTLSRVGNNPKYQSSRQIAGEVF